MKGTVFIKPLEWNIETQGESWKQGDSIKGTIKVKNHSPDSFPLENSGVGLAYAEIKKVQSRTAGALNPELTKSMDILHLSGGAEHSMDFSFSLAPNAVISDKKSSYYLCFGNTKSHAHLQLSLLPHEIFTKIIALMDTFYRFKQKEVKSTKAGVEFKLIPPTSREMSNVDSLLLTLSWRDQNLHLHFNFLIKKLDTTSSKTKINKEKQIIERTLSPKEYSLGGDMLNQDQLLKVVEAVLSDIKIKAMF